MKISCIVVILLLTGALVLGGCMTFRKSDRSFRKEMKKSNLEISVYRDSFENREVRYLSYHKDSADRPVLIFVHGAPGSATSFSDYFKDSSLNREYNMIVVDRMVYGYSSYGKYTPLELQSAWLEKMVSERFSGQKVFLIGHSYGGPIVAHAALKLGTKVSGTIMIAPAIDPEHEKYFWFGKLGYWKGPRWMVSKALQVSASEKYRHAKELKAIEHQWKQVSTPILHIHGNKDNLVPYENLNFSARHFDSSYLKTSTWTGKGHLIPFTEQEKMIKTIISFVNQHI